MFCGGVAADGKDDGTKNKCMSAAKRREWELLDQLLQPGRPRWTRQLTDLHPANQYRAGMSLKPRNWISILALPVFSSWRISLLLFFFSNRFLFRSPIQGLCLLQRPFHFLSYNRNISSFRSLKGLFSKKCLNETAEVSQGHLFHCRKHKNWSSPQFTVTASGYRIYVPKYINTVFTCGHSYKWMEAKKWFHNLTELCHDTNTWPVPV